jgi:kynurenine formamidase
MNTLTMPRYKDLPGGSARGLFGAHDRLGRLNLLTEARVVEAARLVRTGTVISLNAPMLGWNVPHILGDPHRPQPKHTVLHLGDHNDDVIDNWNPQLSTQWDHFFHFPNPEDGSYYNGQHLDGSSMDLWAERGIAGRGVLLDVEAWRREAGRPLTPWSRDFITADDLEACRAASNVTLGDGTLLIVRTGWESAYAALTGPDRARRASKPVAFPGLEPSPRTAEWLWDNGAAAVAADNPTLEAWPMLIDEYVLHTPLLAQLGIPIGELWLLDRLAERCRREARHDFLLTSAPLNLAGAVSSPPNALAIF